MNIFYKNPIVEGINALSQEESRHCVQVLRHKSGDEIHVFDGQGGKHSSVLTKISKNQCEFEVQSSIHVPRKSFGVHLAIAPTKNSERLEWLVEKLCEIGVDQVTFIETKHSERRKLRLDRLEKKALSAMKQSGNPYLLRLSEMVALEEFIQSNESDQKFIAHLHHDHEHLGGKIIQNKNTSILIGPEGDFTIDELQLANRHDYQAVSLGTNTLRTETAGFVACCMVNFINRT